MRYLLYQKYYVKIVEKYSTQNTNILSTKKIAQKDLDNHYSAQCVANFSALQNCWKDTEELFMEKKSTFVNIVVNLEFFKAIFLIKLLRFYPPH